MDEMRGRDRSAKFKGNTIALFCHGKGGTFDRSPPYLARPDWVSTEKCREIGRKRWGISVDQTAVISGAFVRVKCGRVWWTPPDEGLGQEHKWKTLFRAYYVVAVPWHTPKGAIATANDQLYEELVKVLFDSMVTANSSSRPELHQRVGECTRLRAEHDFPEADENAFWTELNSLS